MENVFTLQKRAALAKTLRDASTIGIIASTRQNPDTIGSALALFLALKQSNKQATVVSGKDPLVEISNLFGIDTMKRSFDTAIKQLTISFPFIEGEIEKAMYKTEGDKINVHFYASKDKTITFSEKNVQFIKQGGTPNVIFAIAVSDDEIKEFVPQAEGVTLIRISRHPKDTSGTIVYQDPSFSSVAEIVSKVIQEQGLALDADSAQNLLDGVIFSTHSFTHPKTSAYAFDATGFLLKKGAKRKELGEGERETTPKSDNTEAQEGENIMFGSAVEEMKIETPTVVETPDIKVDSPTNGQKTEETQVEEKSQNEDVPSDWFEPKVFKTSKDE